MESPDTDAVMEWWQRGLVAVLAVTLMVLVLVPCFTPTTPASSFQSDPRIDAGAADVFMDLGPAAVAWLQVVTAGVAGLGMLVAVWAGSGASARGRIRGWAVVMAGLGIVAAGWHMTKATARWEDWAQGGGWIAAAMAGLGAMHLAQFESARRWIVALGCAAALPLLAEAAWYVLIEHPESVRFFEADPERSFSMAGVTAGTEAAELYERRLRFSDATGTFGLSNVLASVAATLGLMGLGVALGRCSRRSLAVGGVVGLAGLATVGLTGSKGAAVAVAAGMFLGLLVWAAGRWKILSSVQRLLPGVAVGLVALAIGAVLVRGAMGPPAPTPGGFVAGAAIEGERSLLFRYQYIKAAAAIAGDHPWAGSGARGFADAYPAAKDPLNPETVTSTHNVLVDQITMLGIGGWAWSGLLLAWLWCAARGLKKNPNTEETSSRDARPATINRNAVWMAVGAAVVLFGLMLWVRQSSMYLDTALLWLVAIAAFVGVAAVLGSPGVVGARTQRLGLLLAATVALVHNQVEMGFFQPTSMGLLWFLAGAAAGGGLNRPSVDTAGEKPLKNKRNGWAVGGAAVLVVGVFIGMVVYAVGATRHESAMNGARAALLRNDLPLAVDRLGVAQHAAGLDTAALRWRVQLSALEPWSYLIEAGRADEARRRMDEALAWIDGAALPFDGGPTTVARLRAALWRTLYETSRSEGDYRLAEAAYAVLSTLSPYNIQDEWARAELARRAGDRDLARQRYERVLHLREQKYLDAADPLTPAQLQHARDFIQAEGD